MVTILCHHGKDVLSGHGNDITSPWGGCSTPKRGFHGNVGLFGDFGDFEKKV